MVLNKWQMIVLGIMVIAICFVLFTAPKYVICQDSSGRSYRVYSNEYNYERLKSRFGSHIEWDTVLYLSIPILLIGGFLVLMLKKVNTDKILDVRLKVLREKMKNKMVTITNLFMTNIANLFLVMAVITILFLRFPVSNISSYSIAGFLGEILGLIILSLVVVSIVNPSRLTFQWFKKYRIRIAWVFVLANILRWVICWLVRIW